MIYHHNLPLKDVQRIEYFENNNIVFKNLRNLHGSGYSDKDRMIFKDDVFAQIIKQMRLIIEYYLFYSKSCKS